VSLTTRYILRQIWVPELIASVVISFVLVAGAIQSEIKTLLKDVPIAQITIMDISWISFYSLPTLAGFLIPVTFLMAIMLTFGRMSQHNEITALKAAGIPLKRLILPVVLMGIALSGVCFFAQDIGQPWAYQHLNQLLRSDLPLRVTIDMLPTGVIHEYGDWRIYVGSKDKDGTLRDIVVLQPMPDGRANAFYAEAARLLQEKGVSKLEMKNVHYILAERKDTVLHTTSALAKRDVPPLHPREKQGERKGLTMRELLKSEQQTAEKYAQKESIPVERELRSIRIELAHRLSFPLMCLAVCIVAAPIGVRTRRAGRSHTFASGLIIIVAYFVLSSTIEPRGLLSLASVIFLVQLPNLIMCCVGSWLIWRVDRI
jgi:lipopolysaccharide export system permease protein